MIRLLTVRDVAKFLRWGQGGNSLYSVWNVDVKDILSDKYSVEALEKVVAGTELRIEAYDFFNHIYIGKLQARHHHPVCEPVHTTNADSLLSVIGELLEFVTDKANDEIRKSEIEQAWEHVTNEANRYTRQVADWKVTQEDESISTTRCTQRIEERADV